MIWLILGLVLFAGSHVFKRLAPDMRQGLGEKGKALVAVLSLAGVVLMVVGYRSAEVIPGYWDRSAPMVGINNLLMLIAVYLFVASGAKTWITSRLRNPQLTAVKVWALAHLLVNGDLASVVLFGGLLAWAVVEVILLKRRKDAPVEQPWPLKGEVAPLLAAILIYAAIAYAHIWLGYIPFG